jgi:hypothetical protein
MIMKRIVLILLLLASSTKGFSFYENFKSQSEIFSVSVGWITLSKPFGFYVNVDDVYRHFGMYYSRNGNFSDRTTDAAFINDDVSTRINLSEKVGLPNNLGVSYNFSIFESKINLKRKNHYTFETRKFDFVVRAGLSYYEKFNQIKEKGYYYVHNKYSGNGFAGEAWIGLRNSYKVINCSLDCGYNWITGLQYGLSIGVNIYNMFNSNKRRNYRIWY